MLPRAVRAASASGVPSQRAVQYVRWLTVAAGSEACRQSETVAGIIGIPRVPCTVALILLKGGLRITQEQLVAAARHRVAGLEIWVLSGDVGLTGLMDDCCDGSLELVEAGDLPAFLKLQPEQLADLLHVAVNKQNHKTAEHILDRLKRSESEAAWQMTKAFRSI